MTSLPGGRTAGLSHTPTQSASFRPYTCRGSKRSSALAAARTETAQTQIPPFHLAFPVRDIGECRCCTFSSGCRCPRLGCCQSTEPLDKHMTSAVLQDILWRVRETLAYLALPVPDFSRKQLSVLWSPNVICLIRLASMQDNRLLRRPLSCHMAGLQPVWPPDCVPPCERLQRRS